MTQIEVSRSSSFNMKVRKPWSQPNLQYETTIHIPIFAWSQFLNQIFQSAILPQSDSFSKINIPVAESSSPLLSSRALRALASENPPPILNGLVRAETPKATALFFDTMRPLCSYCFGEKRITYWAKTQRNWANFAEKKPRRTEGKKSWAERQPLQMPRSTSKSSDHSHDFREVQRPQMPKTFGNFLGCIWNVKRSVMINLGYNRWCFLFPKTGILNHPKLIDLGKFGPKLNFQYPFQLKETIWRSDTLLDEEFLSLWVRPLFIAEPPIQPLDNLKVRFRER